MADNKTNNDGRDSSRIDLKDPSEVEYVHQQFPALSHEEVVEAIKMKGPSREPVMAYLREKSK